MVQPVLRPRFDLLMLDGDLPRFAEGVVRRGSLRVARILRHMRIYWSPND